MMASFFSWACLMPFLLSLSTGEISPGKAQSSPLQIFKAHDINHLWQVWYCSSLYHEHSNDTRKITGKYGPTLGIEILFSSKLIITYFMNRWYFKVLQIILTSPATMKILRSTWLMCLINSSLSWLEPWKQHKYYHYFIDKGLWVF